MADTTTSDIYSQKDVILEDDLKSCLKYGLRVKYQSFEQEKTAQGVKTTFTAQGSYEDCKRAMMGGDGVEPIYPINHTHPVYGNLEGMKISQFEGPIWNLDFTFTTEINWLGISTAKGSTYGKTSSELAARVMSVPLEQHPFYCKCWNYCLYSNNPNALFTKAEKGPRSEAELEKIYLYWIRSDAKNDYIATYFGYTGDPEVDEERDDAGGFLEFGRPDSPPPIILPKKNGKTQNWYRVMACIKPGVEYYEVPTYELTETSKAASKNKAAWVVSKKLGKISAPQEGDFGINKELKGNWLCESASTRFDGKYWLTTMSFLHSGDEKGWDTDLYDYEKGYKKKAWEEQDDLDPDKPKWPDGFDKPDGYRVRKVAVKAKEIKDETEL